MKKKNCEKNILQNLEEEKLSINLTFIFKIKNIKLIFKFINFRKRKKSRLGNKNVENKKNLFYITVFFYYPSLIQAVYSNKKRKVLFIYLQIKKSILFIPSSSCVNIYLLEGKFLLKIKPLKTFLIFKIENVIKKFSKKYIILQDNFKKTSDSKFFKINNNSNLYSSFLVLKQIYPIKFFLWKIKFFCITRVVPNSCFLMKKNNALLKNINIFYKKIIFENQKEDNFFWPFEYFFCTFIRKKLKSEIYIQYRFRNNWFISFILYKISISYFKKSISKNFEVQFEIIRIFLIKGKINRKKLFNFITYHILVIENLKNSYLLERHVFFFKKKIFFFYIYIILYKTVKIKSILLFQKIPKNTKKFLFFNKKKNPNIVNFFSLFNQNLSKIEFSKRFFKNNFNHIELENFIYFSNHISLFKGLPKILEKKMFSYEEKFSFKILYWNICDVFNVKIKKIRRRNNLKKIFENFLISTNFAKIGLENFSRIYLSKFHFLNMENILFFSLLFAKMIYKSGFIGKTRFFFLNGFLYEEIKNVKEKEIFFGFWFFIEYINGSFSIIEKLFKIKFIFQSIKKAYFKKFFFI